MKTTEEKAKAYAESNRTVAMGVDMAFDISRQIESAYLAGAREALSGQWRDPKVELPEKGSECVIVFKSAPQFKYVVDFDGDCFIGMNGVANNVWRWLPIPESPKDESE